jgi:hypothetical protein
VGRVTVSERRSIRDMLKYPFYFVLYGCYTI